MAAKNAFNAAEAEIRELFGEYLDGEGSCAALVMSTQFATETVRGALEKSFATLGFGEDACLYAAVQAPSDAGPLDPRATFMLIEGIDPTYVVCTDKEAAALLAAAYRTSYSLDAYNRVFGRPAAVFTNLDDLLGSETGKRKTWELLKSLPS